MKSSYELAMERLNAQDPKASISLTEQQRETLSEIDRKFKAKIAERDLFLKRQLEQVRQQDDRDQEQQILRQLASEKELLNEEMEHEKDKIRNQGKL